MSLFSAQNRVPLAVPGSNSGSPSIQVDSNLRRWFGRNLGIWRSRRQYTFNDDQVMHVDMHLKMEAFAEPSAGESRYRFSWWSDESNQHSDEFFARKPWYERSGVMEATLWGHQLQRSRGYLNTDPVRTRFLSPTISSGTSLSTSVLWTRTATATARSTAGRTGSWRSLSTITKSGCLIHFP